MSPRKCAVEVDDFHSLVRVADGRCKIVSAGGDAQHTPAGGLETVRAQARPAWNTTAPSASASAIPPMAFPVS